MLFVLSAEFYVPIHTEEKEGGVQLLHGRAATVSHLFYERVQWTIECQKIYQLFATIF